MFYQKLESSQLNGVNNRIAFRTNTGSAALPGRQAGGPLCVIAVILSVIYGYALYPASFRESHLFAHPKYTTERL